MARKKSSSLPTKKLLPAAAAFLVLVVIGFVFLGSKDQSTHRTVPALDVGAYLENSNSLRGNTYKLEGKVSESLAWSPDSGRLIAIEVDNAIIPVLITADFNDMNIQKEQRLVFLVAVDEKGILRTRQVEKS